MQEWWLQWQRRWRRMADKGFQGDVEESDGGSLDGAGAPLHPQPSYSWTRTALDICIQWVRSPKYSLLELQSRIVWQPNNFLSNASQPITHLVPPSPSTWLVVWLPTMSAKDTGHLRSNHLHLCTYMVSGITLKSGRSKSRLSINCICGTFDLAISPPFILKKVRKPDLIDKLDKLEK